MIRTKERLEQIEKQMLAPYALCSADSRGRLYDEPVAIGRTPFQRDRDRIIHTTAFRRLEYKTQVFINYEGDHHRTRLTHTLEVAQLGRSLAQGLGCNETLTEAICLAHDLGHPPFGHAGEEVLDEMMRDHGGFNHNTQSYRVVTELEKRYPSFDGLNLTHETREGMIKHETDYDRSDVNDTSHYDPNKRGSLEAQIANLADEMAYNAHDLEDGLRAAIFLPSALDHLEIWDYLREQIGWTDATLPQMTRHQLIRTLIDFTVNDVITHTSRQLADNQIDSVEKVQMHHENVVGYSDVVRPMIRALKAFLYDNMYRHYRVMRMQKKAERFLSEMFTAYVDEPRMLPTATRLLLEERPRHRVIADYIAGMTDRYALDEWQKLFDPYQKA